MPSWYTYEELDKLKESSDGLKCFYGVVDDVVNRNDVFTYLRLWDQSNCTVVIRLKGSFARVIDRGDVIRVHRFKRKDQGDSHGTIGYGEPGNVTQVVVWRESEIGDGYAMIGSSAGSKYTRHEDEIKLRVEKMHVAWKIKLVADELGISMEGVGNSGDPDSFLNSTVSQRDAAATKPPRNTSMDDSFFNETIIPRRPSPNNQIPRDNVDSSSQNDENSQTNRSVHATDEVGVSSQPLVICSLNPVSIMADSRLATLLEETHQEEQEEEPIPPTTDAFCEPSLPPPLLTGEQKRRLKKAKRLSELREGEYCDVILQVVEAYYEDVPILHVVMRCWDDQSTIPSFKKPLRAHLRTDGYMDRAMITPNESIVKESRGRTVDVYCYDYDGHVGLEGHNIQSGDWVLFYNLKVNSLREADETVLSMHEGGDAYGRCIVRISRELATAKRKKGTHAAKSARKIDEAKHAQFERIRDEEQKSLISRLDSFRTPAVKQGASPILVYSERMIPRCKTIQPYLMWNRPMVPSEAVEDNSHIEMASRLYCNCGAPLDENVCPSPENGTRRHHYFYRTVIGFTQLTDPSTANAVPMKSEILPSLSCLSQRGVSAPFDLVVQMSHLTVEKQTIRMAEGIPLSHVSVWDGTIPPESIGNGKLLRNLTTTADKTVVGNSPLMNLPTIDVRMAKVRKSKAGEILILRNVTIVRAYSEGTEDGSLCPVWMLQARDMDVIRKDSSLAVEEMSAFLKLAKRISTAILSVEERGNEARNEKKNDKMDEDNRENGRDKITVKRKSKSIEGPKRLKIIRMEDRTMIDGLTEKGPNGINN